MVLYLGHFGLRRTAAQDSDDSDRRLWQIKKSKTNQRDERVTGYREAVKSNGKDP